MLHKLLLTLNIYYGITNNNDIYYTEMIACTSASFTYRAMIKAAIFVIPILGLTWLFGLLAINDHTVVFAWIFSVLNSLQVQTYYP